VSDFQHIGPVVEEIAKPLIAPIKTEYAGVLFRSRLEARWAVYLDDIGVRWLYEYEGFEFSNGKRYLPDFFLPELDVYLEIKRYGVASTEEQDKCAWLAEGTHRRVLLACGLPKFGNWDDCGMTCFFESPGSVDTDYFFCECPVCKAVGIEFSGFGDRVCGDDHGDLPRQHTHTRNRFVEAAKHAEQKRFW
jgi:hypothetical protein